MKMPQSLSLPSFSVAEFPLLSKILLFLLAVVTTVLFYQMIYEWLRRRRRLNPSTISSVSESLKIETRFVMTKGEAALYNLVSLATRDSYLVLAKIPYRNLVKITGEADTPRKALLKAIQKVYVDLVLVHPGTLAPAKIVMIERDHEYSDTAKANERLLDTVSQEAGIEVIRLRENATYTVPQLSKLFDLEMEE